MKIELMNRNELVDVISINEKEIRTTRKIFSSLKKISEIAIDDDHAFVVRSPSCSDLPPACIIVGEARVRDWLTWLVTFAPTMRPFTAYCRVIDQSEVKMIVSKSSAETFPIGLLGMAIGESFSAEGHRSASQFQPHPVSMYATTLSYSLARASFLSPGIDLNLIANRWERTRKLTEQRERKIPNAALVKISKIILTAAGLVDTPQTDTMGTAVSVCSELALHGSEKALFTLSADDSLSSVDIAQMTGKLVDREKTFEKALDHLKRHERDVDGREDFIVGFLASMIDPGSLSQIELVMKNVDHFPLSAIWYAACASIADRRRFLSEMKGVGRRILRDLVSGFELYCHPTCDLALSELEVYLDSRAQYRNFLLSVPNHLSVELLPGTQTFVSWHANKKDSPSTRSRENQAPQHIADEAFQLVADEAYKMSEQIRAFSIRMGEICGKIPQ